MSSGDSSSSDNNEKLEEALDSSMFTASSCTPKFKNNDSIRNTKTADHNYKNNILNVTPEFQNFVAKRLTELLDRTIKECHKDIDLTESNSSGGIKLFHESKKLLKDKKFVDFAGHTDNDNHFKTKKRKYTKPTVEEDSENETEKLEKFKSVAVSPSWVLEKKGIIGWSQPKGDSFLYRKNEKNEMEAVNYRS